MRSGRSAVVAQRPELRIDWHALRAHQIVVNTRQEARRITDSHQVVSPGVEVAEYVRAEGSRDVAGQDRVNDCDRGDGIGMNPAASPSGVGGESAAGNLHVTVVGVAKPATGRSLVAGNRAVLNDHGSVRVPDTAAVAIPGCRKSTRHVFSHRAGEQRE